MRLRAAHLQRQWRRASTVSLSLPIASSLRPDAAKWLCRICHMVSARRIHTHRCCPASFLIFSSECCRCMSGRSSRRRLRSFARRMKNVIASRARCCMANVNRQFHATAVALRWYCHNQRSRKWPITVIYSMHATLLCAIRAVAVYNVYIHVRLTDAIRRMPNWCKLFWVRSGKKKYSTLNWNVQWYQLVSEETQFVYIITASQQPTAWLAVENWKCFAGNWPMVRLKLNCSIVLYDGLKDSNKSTFGSALLRRMNSE